MTSAQVNNISILGSQVTLDFVWLSIDKLGANAYLRV